MALITDDNLGLEGDVFYAALMAAHEGRSEEDSARLDTRLVLLLANHIGDKGVLLEAIKVASEDLKSAQCDE